MFGTAAEINLDALKENFINIRNFLPERVKIAGVIKANAYGHDLKTIAKALASYGVDYIAVANIREAVAVRRVLNEMPILVMGYTAPEDYDKAVKNTITLTMFRLEDLRALNLNASYDNAVMKVHIKYDTGFNRLGYKDEATVISDLKQVLQLEWLSIEGIFTHLALKDADSDTQQMKKFDALIKQLKLEGIHIPIAHACDSIGAMIYPDAPYQMVRLGAALYGYCSRPVPFKLRPVMSLKTSVSHLKWIEPGESVSYDGLFTADSRALIATLPIGYADGLPRNLSKGGVVLIQEKIYPIVGLICMDQCMVDVTGAANIQIGDSVELFGEAASLSDVAVMAGTNRNELLSRVAMRVPRRIVQDGEVIATVDYLLGEGDYGNC
ncbi:alanine racemase [Fusibacter paucivorans]|uniref:Alanine racemase n=1 Tax=Fusibacter paucivorans TaxID=76009 RepID=A0ABS5PNU6_9FIRM|nr:alanine racemase [Fusibacter paucivorans]MBS7525722.1 alanine racemase [Fusibacter paucivorans]